MMIIATDLDRTLFPNGEQEYDGSMDRFTELTNPSDFHLVYVTGRNERQILEGMDQFSAPPPEYAVAEVGTKVYRFSDGTLEEDPGYIDYIESKTGIWDPEKFKESLRWTEEIRLQEEEHQNRFKLSYYIDPGSAEKAVEEVHSRLEALNADFNLIYSVDETKNIGLLDVLPTHANKLEGLEYVRQKLGADKEEVVFCGDSGNDLIPLTSGYKAVLVRNALDEVRKQVEEEADRRGIRDRIYFARGTDGLNGYYVSGVIEGLEHFGIGEA
jgi:hypothetical protein